MIDVKYIVNNVEQFVEKMSARNILLSSDDVNEFVKFYNQQKVLRQEIEQTYADANKNIAYDKISLQNKEEELKFISNNLHTIMLSFPNIIDKSVPIGKNESSNVIVEVVGEIPQFDFPQKSHKESGIDFETASRISGTKFSILPQNLAVMERRLIQMFLCHNKLFGFEEVSVPVIVNEESLYNTGQLPKFKDDLYCVGEGKYLIPTGEVPLTNLVAGKIFKENELPKRFTTNTLCFRKEAGSAGKLTEGLIRQHQFNKTEIVSVVSPDKSSQELSYMVECVKTLLNKLKLPYRVVELCSGDLGFSSSKTFDIEVWFPSQNKYVEVSSISNCKNFQSRRMGTKVKIDKKNELVHTLNGSSLAVGRILAALIENNLLEDFVGAEV